MLADKGQNWRSRLDTFVKELPKDDVSTKGTPRGVDATAERALISAGFERLWRAHRKLPELAWEEFVHRHGEEYVARKIGTYEQGRTRGASLLAKPSTARIDRPNDFDMGKSEYGEANVTDGTRAKWSCPLTARLLDAGGMWVWGRVQFRESLEIHSPQSLAVKLGGAVGELGLRSGPLGNPVLVDLDQMKAGLLVGAWQAFNNNLTACLRVGPEVVGIRYDGTGNCGLLLVRDNPKLTVSASNTKAYVTVIRY